MEKQQETLTLKTLADAARESAPSQTGTTTSGSGSGLDVNGVRAEGLDVNTAFDEGGVVVVTKKVVGSEINVETRMVNQDGRDFASGESKGNGVSIDVDVQGSLSGGNGSEKKGEYLQGRKSHGRNRRAPGMKPGEINGPAAAVAEKDNQVTGGNRGIEDLNDQGGGYVMEMDEGDEEYMGEHGYTVGDLVWGKIRSHPWWPGQIYDPAEASEFAVKYNQKGRLLVAYFGDGSFAWCLPSQLIPFAEHFEEMSKQSSSKTFVKAVQEAVDEIGQLVELEMTCSCVPEENRKGLTRPQAVNAGIKSGVQVPGGDIGKLLSFRYDPAELLATVENAAESVSFASMLELAILKSSLSAFYRARGGYFLPAYHERLQIEGLEDKNRNEAMDTNDFSVPIEVPIQGPLEDDWVSPATVSPGKGLAPPDDKIYHRRKQKSVAELMAEDTDAKSRDRKRSSSREGTNASNSANKKRKSVDEVGNGTSSFQPSPTGRKRGRKKNDEISESVEPTACKISKAENGVQSEEMRERYCSSKLKKVKIPVADIDEGEGMKGSEEMSSPRERKKSKYLSPPYTSPRFRAGSPSSKNEIEQESEKVSKIARIGERMTKAAGQLLEPPPAIKSNGKTIEKKFQEPIDVSANLSPKSGMQDQQKIFDTKDVNVSASEVLSGVRSVAVNPQQSLNEKLLLLVGGFISVFRSSIYMNGANYKAYHKRRPGKKRKSMNPEWGNGVNELNQTGVKSPVGQTGGKKNTQEKSDTPKAKKAARGSMKKENSKGVQRKDSPASLIVTFARGFSLPSKDDIIRIYSKFGDLNKQETDVSADSCCVQIVYKSSSGAEEALRASLRQSPFGSANVNYKLCYSSAARVANGSGPNVSSPLKKTPDRPVASQPAADEISQLGSMRQKLKIMTSMLEKCDGKISTEVKSNLDEDIKRLFEKVSMIVETASN